jgi:hypothetical protein
MLLNTILAITRSFRCNLCMNFCIAFNNFSTSKSFCALIKYRGVLTGMLSFNISTSVIVSECSVMTCTGVLLFIHVDKELFRALCTKITT